MDSYFLLTFVVAAIGVFILFRKLRYDQDTKEKDSSYSSSSSSPSSSLIPSSSVPPPSAPHIWRHDVFPSFRGEDVRKDFLSHFLAEFQRRAITPFIDNEIRRGESIGPELIRAIRESKIAVILISKNYASSKWCLDEMVEIMKCREELGQTVLAIFYKVNPSDVKKLTGHFGEVFKKTCAGKTKEVIGRWKQALAKVATIAGYHSINWNNEAAMIKEIAIDIQKKLNSYVLSRDFDGLVGMRDHLEKLEPLLYLDSNEVKMIGIWGPPGIGKTTIARAAFCQISNRFQLSVFMDNIKANCPRPCSDDYSAKLQLQQQLMSQITNQKDMEIPHLGVVQDRLKDKKVLVVLDGVDHLLQLDAMAKETWWFGPGSRIIITTQDLKLLRAQGIKQIYKVDLPSTNEALQIFCMSAFGQKAPKDGFEELSWKVTKLVGELPLGLRVMGSYFRGMSKRDWTKSLPRLETSLDGDIQSILKFSYDALDDEDKDLFLHIACFFNHSRIGEVEKQLGNKFVEVWQRLKVLVEKSLISISWRLRIEMHSSLEKLGREIVRKQSIQKPGQRQFLVNGREICELLSSDATGSENIVGIDFEYKGEELRMKEGAFERMSDLRFLRIKGVDKSLYLPRGLKCLSPKLQLLDWSGFPMICLPSTMNVEFLVELIMHNSKLMILWKGNKWLPNLKRMILSGSKNLKLLHDLSTATRLQELDLRDCSCLLQLDIYIGNATNLRELDLSDCSSLSRLPPSIGNLQKLEKLILRGCSKLKVLPRNINLKSLEVLDLAGCSMLKSFPVISTNIEQLDLIGTAIEEVPLSIQNWPRLLILCMSYFENLKEFPHALDIITKLKLSDTEIQEIPPWVMRFSRLHILDLKGCRKLVSLPQIPDSVCVIHAEGCQSLERLDMDLSNATQLEELNLRNCSSLTKLPSSIGNATNLLELDLSNCLNLVELPFSIGNLEKLKRLILKGCSNLVEFPSSIVNATTNLDKLDLSHCSSLRKFPTFIWNATNLWELDLSGCSILVELPLSIGNLQKLNTLRLRGCSKLEVLPVPANINLRKLHELDLTDCSMLKSFPEISTNIQKLWLEGTKIEQVPLSIRTWPRLDELCMSYFKNLKEFPHALDIITRLKLSDAKMQEVPPWIKRISRLREIVLVGCRQLVSLPQFLDSLSSISVQGCESLERLDCSFHNSTFLHLNFAKCFKLNQEARDLIIQSPLSKDSSYSVIPGREVPSYFTHRATCGEYSVTINLNESCLPKFMRFKACFWLLYKGDDTDWKAWGSISVRCWGPACFEAEVLREHLYIFNGEAVVTSNEFVFDFSFNNGNDMWEIGEFGLLELS